MIHLCIRGRDVFVERDEFETHEDAVFRAWYLTRHVGADPHAEEMSRIESCKRKYGTSYVGVTRPPSGVGGRAPSLPVPATGQGAKMQAS